MYDSKFDPLAIKTVTPNNPALLPSTSASSATPSPYSSNKQNYKFITLGALLVVLLALFITKLKTEYNSYSMAQYTTTQLIDICHTCVPGWAQMPVSQIGIQQLHGGMTNALYVCWRKHGMHDEPDALKKADSIVLPSDGYKRQTYNKVVVRVFGNDTSIFFNRENEQYITKTLLKTSNGPRVLCEFPNGRIERFINGRTLTCPQLHVNVISHFIAAALARFHQEHIDLRVVDNRNSTKIKSSDSPLSSIEMGAGAFFSDPRTPILFTNIRQWLKIARTIREEDMKYALNDMNYEEQTEVMRMRRKMMQFLKLDTDEPDREIAWLEKQLRLIDSPVLFCHNDAQEGNVIVDGSFLDAIHIDDVVPYTAALTMSPIHTNHSFLTQFGLPWVAQSLPHNPNVDGDYEEIVDLLPEQDIAGFSLARVHKDSQMNPCHLIDFEYAGWNYRGFDLANHICEHYIDYSYSHWPYFVIVPSLLPGKEQLNTFSRHYLEAARAYSKQSGKVTDEDIESLSREMLWFTLASNLMWTYWGVIQAGKSTLNFGYLEYGVARYQEYLRLKEALTSGDEMNVYQWEKYYNRDA